MNRRVHSNPIAELEAWLARVEPNGERSTEEMHEELGSMIEELHVALEALSEKQAAVASLQLEERRLTERYRDLFDGIADAVLVTDLRGIIESANRPAGALFGVSASDLVRKPLAMYLDSSVRREFRSWLRELREAQGATAQRSLIARPHGGPSVAVRMTVVCDGSRLKGAREMRWTIHDATEERAAEERLRSSEDLFRSVFHGGPDAIAVVRMDDGRVVEANEVLGHLVALSVGEIVGATLPALGFEMPEMARFESEILGGASIRNVPVTLKGKEKGDRLLLASGRRVHVAGVDLVTWFLRDVTRAQRLEAEFHVLQEENARRGRLAEIGALSARIIHDVGNPLSGISMLGHRIVHTARSLEAKAGEQIVEAGTRIVEQTDQLMARLRQLLDAGKGRWSAPAVVDLADVARGLAAHWRLLAHRRRSTIVLEIEKGLPTIISVAEPIRRIVENLLHNALDAVETGPGAIVISACRHEGGLLRISVRDDGPGIPDDFDPFVLFQTTKPLGTGLGLVTSRELAWELGGSLGFTRLEPRGVEFHLDLPVEGGPQPHSSRGDAAGGGGDG